MLLILYILLSVLGTIALLVIVAGFASPRVARFQKSTEIAAPPAKIFPYLNSVKRFSDEWSPWTDKDPDATHTFSRTGPEMPGQAMRPQAGPADRNRTCICRLGGGRSIH